MLVLDGARLDLPLYILDQEISFPAGGVNRLFMEGDFTEYGDVLAFGREMDIITIEIEKVNIDALFELESMGKIVHPNPRALEIIRDKGKQKQFFVNQGLPTSSFSLVENLQEWEAAAARDNRPYPVVQKLRSGGYDGRGVSILHSPEAIKSKWLSGPSVMEELVNIHKEIAVIAARNAQGQVLTYEPVEMVFDPEANLVDMLFCPAAISEQHKKEAADIAAKLIKSLDICGLLAVEFFIDATGTLLINEVAPRPHNSGHHTIESCATSQFQQHLRGILNWPLGDVTNLHPAAMVNLLGEPGYQGPVYYQGIEKVLEIPQAYIHLYGKEETKPSRKMGHITVLGNSAQEAIGKAKSIQERIKVISIT